MKCSAGSTTAPSWAFDIQLQCWKMNQHSRFLLDSSVQPPNFTEFNSFSSQQLPVVLIRSVREASRCVFLLTVTVRLQADNPHSRVTLYNCQFICYFLCSFPSCCDLWYKALCLFAQKAVCPSLCSSLVVPTDSPQTFIPLFESFILLPPLYPRWR